MLQKPFFDAEYDMARNFGGVGAFQASSVDSCLVLRLQVSGVKC